jgi:quercetin dioxygenase-like cupin family protein
MSGTATTATSAVRSWEISGGEQRHAPFPGGPTVRIVVGADAAEAVAALEVTVPAGGGMPEHDHGESAVLLAPLEGRLRLVEPGSERTTELDTGVLATIPVGCRVRLENPGDVEARALVVLTPPQFAEQLAGWPT